MKVTGSKSQRRKQSQECQERGERNDRNDRGAGTTAMTEAIGATGASAASATIATTGTTGTTGTTATTATIATTGTTGTTATTATTETVSDPFLSEPEEHGFDFDGLVQVEGVIEVQQEGHAFLALCRLQLPEFSPDDVYVSAKQLKQFGLQTGDTVVAGIRPPRIGEKYYPLIDVKSVNGRSPEWIKNRVPFKFLDAPVPARALQAQHSTRHSEHTTHGPVCPHW